MGIIYIVAPVVFPSYNKLFSQSFLVGAASNKVEGLAQALNLKRNNIVVVSAPVVTNSKKRIFFPMCNFLERGFSCKYASVISLWGINRVFSMLSLLYFIPGIIKSKPKVIFYNYYPEYLLFALVLNFFIPRSDIYLDIEDAPRGDSNSFRDRVNGFSLSLLRRISNSRLLCVSSEVAKGMGAFDSCIVNGIARQVDLKRADVLLSETVTVHYGGLINRETGVDIFIGALKLISEEYSQYSGRLKFVVTGYGDLSDLNDFLQSPNYSNIKVYFKPNVSKLDYDLILKNSDVGLSLRVSDSGYANTTFPSKVIEIASAGLLLVTTCVSDIETIFDTDSAVFLREQTAKELAKIFVSIVSDRGRFKLVASNGQVAVNNKFSLESIGKSLDDFIYERGS